MQCHVGLYFLSNSFLTYDAMSFSILYRSSAYKRFSYSNWKIPIGLVSEFLFGLIVRQASASGATARTWAAQSIASVCMSSDMSAFLMTALRSDILRTLD